MKQHDLQLLKDLYDSGKLELVTDSDEERDELATAFGRILVEVQSPPKNIGFFALKDSELWDNVEYHPCMMIDGTDKGGITQCEEHEAEFWSVYVHIKTGGLSCVADLPTKELALNLVALIESLIKTHQNG